MDNSAGRSTGVKHDSVALQDGAASIIQCGGGDTSQCRVRRRVWVGGNEATRVVNSKEEHEPSCLCEHRRK